MTTLHLNSQEDKPAASTPDPKRLIIASNNNGKLREFAKLFEPFGFEVISMRQAGFTDSGPLGIPLPSKPGPKTLCGVGAGT